MSSGSSNSNNKSKKYSVTWSRDNVSFSPKFEFDSNQIRDLKCSMITNKILILRPKTKPGYKASEYFKFRIEKKDIEETPIKLSFIEKITQ